MTDLFTLSLTSRQLEMRRRPHGPLNRPRPGGPAMIRPRHVRREAWAQLAGLPILDKPTIGAWRRAHGIDGASTEARHALATAVIQEAGRQATAEQLESLFLGLHRGHNVDTLAARLVGLGEQLGTLGSRDLDRRVAA